MPEAQRKLAGGEAKRNHWKHSFKNLRPGRTLDNEFLSGAPAGARLFRRLFPAVSPQANICRAYSAKTSQFNLQNSYHVTSVSKVVRLVRLCFLIDQSIGHGDAQSDLKTVLGMAEELNYTQEQVQALLAEVAEEYARDRGAGLVRAAFGEE